jgi:hypothetical protein
MAQIKGKVAKQVPKSAKKLAAAKVEEKRVYFKQADFPQSTLQQAQRIATALVDTHPLRWGHFGVSGVGPSLGWCGRLRRSALR